EEAAPARKEAAPEKKAAASEPKDAAPRRQVAEPVGATKAAAPAPAPRAEPTPRPEPSPRPEPPRRAEPPPPAQGPRDGGGRRRAGPSRRGRLDGPDVVKPRDVHLGIAVSTPRGLVVPVVRGADGLGLAALEQAIGDVARRARDGRLTPGDLAGGTFTITNGGV